MTPKKKTIEEPILAVLALVLAVFLALHISVAYDLTLDAIEQEKIEASSKLYETVRLTVEQLGSSPWKIYWTDYSKSILMWFVWGWFIMVLMYTTSKKNYIQGKEYGTSRWATKDDIRDLFASSILKQEIRKVKQRKYPWGRYAQKRKARQECKQTGELMLKRQLEDAALREELRKKNGTENNPVYKEEIRQIKKETADETRNMVRLAWPPDLYKEECRKECENIRQSVFFTDSEKDKRIRRAEDEYKRKKAEFYDTSVQVKKLKQKYADADMLFTNSERISFYNYKLNNNVLIIGGSGSGKTRGYVMPNVLQAHSSYVITDPKGEILEKAGYFLETVKGYKIRVLNLDDKGCSDGYNPFVYIHPERPDYEERVLTLIETIILNTDGGKTVSSPDPFWPKAERLFLQSIFFFTCDGFVEEERNMTTVMRLIAMLDIAEDEDNYDSDLDYFAKIFEERFGSEHIGVLQYKEFRSKASGKTAKSIVISAVARLAPFRTSGVKKIFSQDAMQLDRVGEEKMAVFVVTPPTDSSFNFIAGMLFTQLFQELQYCATQVHKHEGQRLPVPCRFILDEYANVAQIPNFVKILAYARSFGIGITVILQSLEQIKGMHEKEWGVIIDNCNTMLYLGAVQHQETLDYISKLLGKGTFDKKTTGRTRGRQGTSNYNNDVIGRELMDASEIRRLPKDKCLMIVSGRHPFYSQKYEYMSHPNYLMTSDGNAALSYEYKPQPFTLVKPVSHGEKQESLVVPDKDSVVVPDGMRYDGNQTLAEKVRNFADDSKNAAFVPCEPDEITEQDCKVFLQEVEEEENGELDAITEALIQGSGLVKETLEEVEDGVQEEPFLESMQSLGRSFRSFLEAPVGFVGPNIDMEKMTEDEKDLFLQEAENILFEEEVENIDSDDSLTEEFQEALKNLNDAIRDFEGADIMRELVSGNVPE